MKRQVTARDANKKGSLSVQMESWLTNLNRDQHYHSLRSLRKIKKMLILRSFFTHLENFILTFFCYMFCREFSSMISNWRIRWKKLWIYVILGLQYTLKITVLGLSASCAKRSRTLEDSLSPYKLVKVILFIHWVIWGNASTWYPCMFLKH